MTRNYLMFAEKYILVTMFSSELLLMLSILMTALLLFISVYFMITLSDLESDYINRYSCFINAYEVLMFPLCFSVWTAPPV